MVPYDSLLERAMNWCALKNINPNANGVRSACHMLAQIGLVPDGKLAVIVPRRVDGVDTHIPVVMIDGMAKFCRDRGMVIVPPQLIWDGDVIDGDVISGTLPPIELRGGPHQHKSRHGGILIGGYCTIIHPATGPVTTVVDAAFIDAAKAAASSKKLWESDAHGKAMMMKAVARKAMSAAVRYMGVDGGDDLATLFEGEDDYTNTALPRQRSRRSGGAVALPTAAPVQQALPQQAAVQVVEQVTAQAPVRVFSLERAVEYARQNGNAAAIEQTAKYYGSDAVAELMAELGGES